MKISVDYFYKILPVSLLVICVGLAYKIDRVNIELSEQRARVDLIQVKQRRLLEEFEDYKLSSQTKDKELENGLANNYKGLMALIEDLQRKLN